MDSTTTQNLFSLDMGFVRGLITALTMFVFLCITWWAYHRGNRERFEADAMMPFLEDEPITAGEPENTAATQGEDEE